MSQKTTHHFELQKIGKHTVTP